MYNESLNEIKENHKTIIESIVKLESDESLKKVLKNLTDLILSTANASLFAVDNLSKKIGSN